VAIIDPRHAAKQFIYERVFRAATLAAAILVLLILGGVALSLVRGAWPAVKHFGFGFVTREVWNPVTDEYGALGPIYGTVVTSLIAMALAVPTGFGIALFLTELCPPWLKRPIGVAVELLAAVPSIIFGIWAFSSSPRSCSGTCSRGSSSMFIRFPSSACCSRVRRSASAS